MAKFAIDHDRPNCIGCGACAAVCPEFWEMDADGKSGIKGGKTMPNEWEQLEFEDKDLACHQKAAETCPVNVIHLTNKQTGEKII